MALRRNSYLIVLFLFFILLILVVSGVFLLSSFLFINKKANKVNNQTEKYKYSEVNPTSGISSQSIVSMPRTLYPFEFVSYSKENGDKVLISNFEEPEYVCSGTCLCSDNQRRNVGVIGRGAFVLLTALSSMIAVKYAKDLLQQECNELFSNMCESSLLSSTVEDCKDVSSIKENFLEPDDENDLVTFGCIGYCVPSGRLKTGTSQDLAENFRCEDLKISEEVYVSGTTKSSGNGKAKSDFRKLHLTPFCKESSVVEYTYKYFFPDGSGSRNRHVKSPLCVSGDTRITNNVNCFKK